MRFAGQKAGPSPQGNWATGQRELLPDFGCSASSSSFKKPAAAAAAALINCAAAVAAEQRSRELAATEAAFWVVSFFLSLFYAPPQMPVANSVKTFVFCNMQKALNTVGSRLPRQKGAAPPPCSGPSALRLARIRTARNCFAFSGNSFGSRINLCQLARVMRLALSVC